MNVFARFLAATGRRHAALLGPGTLLMRRLRMRSKLLLIAGTLVVPLLLMMGASVHEKVRDWRFADVERHGVKTVSLTLPVATALRTHRIRTMRALLGEGAAAQPLAESTEQLRQAATALEDHLSKSMPYALEDVWRPLRQRLDAIAEGRHPQDVKGAFAEHSAAVEGLRHLVQLTGERSGLVLDPEARTYFLMDTLINGVMPPLEAISVLRARTTAYLAGGTPDGAERVDLLGRTMLLAQLGNELAGKLAALERAGGAAPGSWPDARAQLTDYIDTLRVTLESAPSPALATRIGDAGLAATGGIAALARDGAHRLDQELGERQRRIASNIALSVGIFVAGLLAMAYLFISFMSTFGASLRVLQHTTASIQAGDLSTQAHIDGRDELADIGQGVEQMSHRLSALVSEIRDSASMVNMTGQQVADGSAKLATRTDEQATSLRDSVAVITQLSGAVARNADAAQQLDALMQRVSAQAESGGTLMGESLQAMQRMQEASARVAHVVGVIDEVAFQTNVLSLNAAIEASRAGEAGRGFATVAAEVRQLAVRCAESAEEIRSLIGDATVQVEVTGTKLGNVSESLGTIVDGVREVSTQLREISASSSQQSTALHEVTDKVGNLDEIMRHNSALVEISMTASHALLDRSTALRGAVESIRLRRGSADEAVALVERARAHITDVGLETAMADFHAPDLGYIDRDLYVFVLDRNGIYCACGGKPEMVGQSVTSAPGIDERFVERVWTAADAGGGWVQYQIVNPVSGEVMPKESWVVGLSETHLIGCGIYRNVSAADAPPRAVPWSRQAAAA